MRKLEILETPRRRTPLFDRCLDWMFDAYVRATTRPEVKDYLTRHPDLDRALVKMIVKIRTRIPFEIELDAEMVNFSREGEYLEVVVRQAPRTLDFAAAVQSIWHEEAANLRPSHGWIALLAGDRVRPKSGGRAPADAAVAAHPPQLGRN